MSKNLGKAVNTWDHCSDRFLFVGNNQQDLKKDFRIQLDVSGRQGHPSGVTLAIEHNNNDDNNNMRFQKYPNSYGRDFTL